MGLMPDDQNSTTGSLQIYRGDLLALSREWTTLHDDEITRRAVTAARDKDIITLVSLTTAHLSHAGGSGVLTSPHTVKAYELGVRQFLVWATDQAVNLL